VTLLKSGSVWKKLVLDAKKRGCFYEANEDKSLAHVMTRLFFFYIYIQNVKRVIAVAQLRVAQPTYGTCPITCTRSSELRLTAEYNN
jgi:hypothetical protein